ncbi:MAG: hypothetical protein JW934_21510 [Anaerolineae bacterium]|nr:hypothetical protein [Anaerolineae bacterium]
MIPLPSRQIHLDFHTSEHIPGVGSRFDKKQFQAALQVGHVNLINIFAKCHHSWSYYPTQVGKMHPTLQIDLLGQQIEACHEIGVRCPIYFTVGWSATDAEEHPEWCIHHQDGSIAAARFDLEAPPDAPRPPGSWKFMCPSGDYLALILAQTQEICERYDVDGFWYDIHNTYPVCYCDNCRQGMAQKGIDPNDEQAVFGYSVRTWKHMMRSCTEIIKKYHPNASIYFNGTTKLTPSHRNIEFKMYEYNTQQDLEDLPTTWGGYDEFPLRAKLFHNIEQPIVAMSGKFHTSWGEFGGFKHPDALRYEAASMVAFGAACNFGDQLHPLGEMDLSTYANIGEAFKYVEQIEDYGVGARSAANLGLWFTNSKADDEGTVAMLLETQTDFGVVDLDGDWSKYAAIVLPGAVCLTEAQAAKLNEFAKNGGGLLVLGESALDTTKTRFLLNVGASYVGPGEFDIDYLVVGERLRDRIVKSPFLNYEAAMRVQPNAGTEILAAIREPYFSRTYGKYCSHLNTPYKPDDAAHPGVLRRGNVVFVPHPLGRMYFNLGARVHRDLFVNALSLIYADPMIKTQMPSAGRISLLHQPEQNRYVAHLLYGPPMKRGRCLVIEDLVPLYNIPVELDVPHTIQKAYLVPGESEIAYHRIDDKIQVVVPKIQCHQAIVFEY